MTGASFGWFDGFYRRDREQDMATVGEARNWHPYVLSGMAGCGDPDSAESAGAEFLRSVLADTLDRVEYERGEDVEPSWSWSQLPDAMEDAIHEIADAAPDVYTYRRWQEFTDLAGWQEDPSEVSAEDADMTTLAGVCLYLIAERLARAIVEALAEQDGAGVR